MPLTLEELRTLRDRAGLFLDFDGSLSEIVARPELVQPAEGVLDVLAKLAGSYALVGIVTGRPGADVERFLPVPGLRVFGVYGLEGAAGAASIGSHRPDLERVVADVPGAWVEDKGVSLTVHYRQAPDPAQAERVLRERVGGFADRRGLVVVEGKRAVEVASARIPGKGQVVLEQVRSGGLRGCLYAGDDLADLEAFAALDQLAGEGVGTLKVAVRSEETPGRVIEQADLVVERPEGLVRLLRDLA